MSVAPFLWLVKKQYSVTPDIPDSALCTSYRKQLPVLSRGTGNAYWGYEAAFLELKIMNLTSLNQWKKSFVCLILVFKGFFVHSGVQHSKVPQPSERLGINNISGHASCHES